MATTQTEIKATTLGEVFAEAIKKALESEFEHQFEESKKQMINKLDERKDEVLASLTLKLMKHISMESYGEKLIITLDTKKLSDTSED